jgi:yecA family protein
VSRRRGRIPALSLNDLGTWLAGQPDIARRNWTVTSIDGFCAAPLAGPERTETAAWLRVIFGPELPTTPMGLGTVQAVLEHHEAVRRMLALNGGRRWQPLYLCTDNGTVIAQPWAAGFMVAVKRWPAAWQPMFERGDHVALMLPIIACDATEEV